MTEPLPKWLVKRYAVLWKNRGDKKISFEDVKADLDEKNSKKVSAILSNFKKAGWLEVELHPETSRKRLYKLKPPEKAILEIANSE